MQFTPEIISAAGGFFGAACGGVGIIIGALRGRAEKAGTKPVVAVCPGEYDGRIARIENNLRLIMVDLAAILSLLRA